METESILGQPFTINGLTLKNRFVRSGTYEGMATEDGKVTEDLHRLYRRLADGGCGLIIPGYAYIAEEGQCNLRQIGIYGDGHIEGLRELVKTIHDHGAKTVLQLVHAGHQIAPGLVGRISPMAPSVIEVDQPSDGDPREMSREDIEASIRAFGDAAARAKDAGFDGVQIHAAHGYLIAQFLSPHTNRRTDDWGGTAENRMAYLREVYHAVRSAVGPDYPVLVKLNTDDGLPDGIQIGDAVYYAEELAELGIDAIEPSGGTIDTGFVIARGDIPIDSLTAGMDDAAKSDTEEQFHAIRDDVAYQEAYWLDAAMRIREASVETPLILVGGMKYPRTMAQIIGDGKADMISMCRPLIKEPNLPNEILAGRKSPVRCAFCNLCFAGAFAGDPTRCRNR